MELLLVTQHTQLICKSRFLFFKEIVIPSLLQHLLQTPIFTTICYVANKKNNFKTNIKSRKQILPKRKKIQVIDNACKCIYVFLSLNVLTLRDN